VVLETDKRAGGDVLDLHVDHDVTNEAFLAGFSSHVDEADAGESLAFRGLVIVAEKLVAATDGEHRGAGLDSALQWRLLVLDEVFIYESLLAVLPPAEEEDVHVLHVLGGAAAELHESRVVVAPFGALEQREDVSPVPVDVHEVGIEPADREGLLLSCHFVALLEFPTFPSRAWPSPA